MNVFDQLDAHYTHVGVLLTPDVFMGIPLAPYSGASFESNVAVGFNPTMRYDANIHVKLSQYALSMRFHQDSDPVYFIDMRKGVDERLTLDEAFRLLACIDDANESAQQQLRQVYFYIQENKRPLNKEGYVRGIESMTKLEITGKSSVRFYFGPDGFEFVYDELDRDHYILKDAFKEGQFKSLKQHYSDKAMVLGFEDDMVMYPLPK